MFDRKKEDQASDKVMVGERAKTKTSSLGKEEKNARKTGFDFSFDFTDKLRQIGLPKIIIVLAVGIIILIVLSDSLSGLTGTSKNTKTTTGTSTQNVENNNQTDEYIGTLENRLKQVLMKVEDIGQVEVMITVKSSRESVVLKDENKEESKTEEEDSAGGSRKNSSASSQDETVFQQSESGVSSPYIVKELEPEIEGILVIADGGNSEVVKSEVVAAVQVLFNVPAHKIKVMKMNE
ncbi:MAG: stage III sporulation protein AG [bacterium]|nr:stage III sporulation protein AG [bacterium]